MPFKTHSGRFEKASRLGHVTIVQSDFVKGRLKNYVVPEAEENIELPEDLLVPAADLPKPDFEVKWAMAFDGSPEEVPVREKYPSTRVGYIQIAGVLVHLEELLKQNKKLFVDPSIVRESIQDSIFPIVLPGSNVRRPDFGTVRDSWRVEIYELFKEYKIEDRSIISMYLRLMELADRASASGDVILRYCSATPDCEARTIPVPIDGCACPECGGILFPTDALRMHEEVSEYGPNETSLGRLMNFLERITLLCYVDFLFERQPRVLSKVAFITDGPLALFGPQAPFKTGFIKYFQYIAQELKANGQGLPIIVGLEKGGQFVDHAEEIAEYLPRQTLMRLPDQEYIFKRILTTRPAHSAFGKDDYYGRKFYYKTAKGQMLTITVPCFDQSLLEQYKPDDPVCYETLPNTLALLDEIGTHLYKDAIIPVALAHNYASIPLKTGTKVLTLLSREMLNLKAA